MNDFDLYIIAELKYKKAHRDIPENKLFPFDWYSSRNYVLKTKIILEAIKKNIEINKTDLYQENFIERINKD